MLLENDLKCLLILAMIIFWLWLFDDVIAVRIGNDGKVEKHFNRETIILDFMQVFIMLEQGLEGFWNQ